MNLALKDAVTQGHLKNNPVPGARTYKRRKPNVIILSKEKLKVLLAAASKSNWYLEILLAVFCGLRKGEIGGLKYSDVDYINRTLTIQRQLGIEPNSRKEDFAPKTFTKQEIGLKSESSYRVPPIPD